MPKLTEKTLEKRFTCEHCGKTFRTRQGLSGHIQFKHQAYYKSSTKSKTIVKDIDMKFISSKQKDLVAWQATSQLSKSNNDTILGLIINWVHVMNLFSALDIELTKQDFKNYLLAGMGKLFS